MGMTVICTDCNKPRCLYAFKKILDEKKKIFVVYFNTICYTCEATFAYYNKAESENDSKEESS
jgi:hypothetical protein